MAGRQPDAPDPVPRGRLHEDPVAGGEQEVSQVRVLAELGCPPSSTNLIS